MAKLTDNHGEKIRFAGIGLASTALDFFLLFVFVHVGVNEIAANYMSTGITFFFSFFANRSYTFREAEGNIRRQFVLFIAVTMIGIWVFQPIVIWGVLALPLRLDAGIWLLVAKLAATGVSLVWNYLLYSRLVFRTKAPVPSER